MNLIDSLVLGIIEGITEFLPVSSTGHLILTSELLKINQTDFVKSFEIIIQLGAILAVICLYFKQILINPKVWTKIIVAFSPTAIVGLFFYKFIKNYLLGNSFITLVALFLGGVALIILELIYKEKEYHANKIEDVSLKTSFLIGIFQSVSVVPGVSRAAATIVGGLFVGLKRKTATEFSFLLAIPTMAAASGLDLIKTDFSFSGEEVSVLLVGFISSFIVAVLSIKFLLNYIRNHNFIPFGIYRIALSILFWIFILRG